MTTLYILIHVYTYNSIGLRVIGLLLSICMSIRVAVNKPLLCMYLAHFFTRFFVQLLSSHFTYFARYYESGQRCFGLASEEEKVWSALVVYRLLDTLSNKLPHEKLERSCVACLQAVSCAIVPDTLLPSQCQLSTMCRSSAVGYDPRPACIARVTMLRSEVKQFVNDFANFLHDCWVFEQVFT